MESHSKERMCSYLSRPGDYVGNPVQRDMQSRAYDFWRSAQSDPRYAYEGRLVALDGTSPDNIDELLLLIRKQRAAIVWYLTENDEIVLAEKLSAMGYATDRWDQYLGAAEALRVCEKLRDKSSIPKGYEVGEINAGTPDLIIAEFAAVAAGQGVMVPAAHVMRGLTRPSTAMYITAPSGNIVAIAGSVLGHHRDSPLAGSAWWGMLCTHPDHRGRGLSKILGAMSMLAMARRHGATSFYTGVRRNNAVSQAVCMRLGVRRTEHSVLMAVSPEISGGGPLTR
jgi:GNAT superfamily N-acetyltransferase